MAFGDLKPVKIYDESTGRTIYIGDVFAVYPFGAELPSIYSWEQISSVEENRGTIAVTAENERYVIEKRNFSDTGDYFRAVAIIECAYGKYGFAYSHQKRVLPLKSNFIEIPYDGSAYFGQSVIDENDIASTYIMLMNYKLVKVLWLVAILMMLLIFGVLHFTIGVTRENILYFLPISIAGGGIVTLIVYIVCYLSARSKYQAIASNDPSSDELLSFLIAQNGFAVCESCIYENQDIIPWSAIDYFIESDKMYILYKNGMAIAYIPKSAFDKKYQGNISDILALNLEQR